ncbi:trypsin-3-like [Chrysoperla carnea]|uniref:trypsin-3-like n=1 Tax=Chrysoperla carnea TaxID=189513 RepID=UPI001D0907C7|nr:trypsin-3-like [Chrysoperla carnea]
MYSILFINYIVVIVLAYATIDCNAALMDHRIVHGENARIEQYPYQVYILRVKSDYQCGGALISSSVVLTAAHCYPPNDQQGTVRAGSTNRKQGGQVRQIKRGILHSQYSGANLQNDIAVLFVDRPFQLTSSVKPIRLPVGENDNPRVGDIGVTTGWGYLGSSENVPHTLRQVKLPVMDQKICQQQQNKFLIIPITANKLCAGYLYNAKAICQGDSGGPYVVNGVLHGITSHNSGPSNCGKAGVPSVFTRVSSYRTWIRNTVQI